MGLNTLTAALRDFCAGHRLEEKWLLCPTRRVGAQWLETVTRSGLSVLDLRVKTLRQLAVEIAAPELERQGLSLLGRVTEEHLVRSALARLRAREGGGYLGSLRDSPGLARALAHTLRDLRSAGLSSVALARTEAFEVGLKGREVRDLLVDFEQELTTARLLDGPGVLRLAIARLRAGLCAPRACVLLPDDLELCALERELCAALPAACRLPVDPPGGPAPAGPLTDSARLRWLYEPAEAPPPRGDASVRIFHAVGEANEVREVLRCCLARGVPFDDVEILHTDAATYVPLVAEVLTRVWPEGRGPLPVTFAEGVPVSESRPGRALRAWVEWIGSGFLQSALVQMIQDGLLLVPAEARPGPLAAVLQRLPIGAGRSRTLEVISDELARVERRLAEEREDLGPDGASLAAERRRQLALLLELVTELVRQAPDEDASPPSILASAASFLAERVFAGGRIDEYGRRKLLREIDEARRCFEGELDGAARRAEPGRADPGAEEAAVRSWLADLPRETRVEGQGPRPGCLHVAPLLGGGHSGRGHTFIVGLDDGRFPGAGRQDPLLLDRERERLSAELPTAAARLAGQREGFARLLARLRGEVCLSYAQRGLADDREQFPSSLLLSAYRVVTGDADGDLTALLDHLGAPVSFAPEGESRCADLTEWWLWRLCAGERPAGARDAVAVQHPHLGRGFVARRARESERFTEFDGYVPQAGAELDPTRADGPVLSATALERMGRCPLEYFFRHGLGISPPSDPLREPGVWLEASERGALLHDVFHEFMVELRGHDLLPEHPRDLERLNAILERHVAVWRRKRPVPSDEAFARERQRLELVARMFLREEHLAAAESLPSYFEVAVGMPSSVVPTALDTRDPAALALPGGGRVRVRARIDRVDRARAAGEVFSVWDYKTGSSAAFDEADPFGQGRHVQGTLYTALARARLRETVSPRAEVARFGYLFLNPTDCGRRISWEATDLAEGEEIVALLCRMIAAGCFPLSDEVEDLERSDFCDAWGDPARERTRLARKLSSDENPALEGFRRLRGHDPR